MWLELRFQVGTPPGLDPASFAEEGGLLALRGSMNRCALYCAMRSFTRGPSLH